MSVNFTFGFPKDMTAEDLDRYAEKVKKVMINSAMRQIEKEIDKEKKQKNIYEHYLCPQCSKYHIRIEKEECFLLGDGHGFNTTVCECLDCGRRFSLNVEFEYKIKQSQTYLLEEI